jgi:hypothetical protein
MAIAPAQLDTGERVVSEITDFFLASPSLEEIAAFKFSPELDQRLHQLLDREDSGRGLMSDEREELDALMRYSHLLVMIKAKARLKLSGKA